MAGLFSFEHVRAGGLHWHVMRASDEDIVEPLWPGLWELEYGDDSTLNPFLRFGINNGEGESLAVWRALAWAMTMGKTRVGLPGYYRDEAAQYLGVDPKAVTLIPWEYQVELEQSRFADANKGFVAARSAVSTRPAPGEWQRDHQRFAGLFELTVLDDLTKLELAVAFDASSEISIFGLVGRDTSSLGSLLNTNKRPDLSDVLAERDVFADLSLTRDRFPGTHSYLSFASHQDLDKPLSEAAAHFETQWSTYCREYGDVTSLEEFAAATERLLRMPQN